MIAVKHIAKYVVGLGEKVAPTDIEEGMRLEIFPHISKSGSREIEVRNLIASSS